MNIPLTEHPSFQPAAIRAELPKDAQKRHAHLKARFAHCHQSWRMVEAERSKIHAVPLAKRTGEMLDRLKQLRRDQLTVLQEELELREELGAWLAADYRAAMVKLLEDLRAKDRAIQEKIEADLTALGFKALAPEGQKLIGQLIVFHPEVLASKRDVRNMEGNNLLLANPLMEGSPFLLNQRETDRVSGQIQAIIDEAIKGF